MYSDGKDKDEPDNAYALHTKKMPVREFGGSVEQLHANGNNAFREQFFVSHLSLFKLAKKV